LDDETSEDSVSGIVPFPVTERAKPLWTEVFTGAEWLVGVPGAVVAAFSAPPGGSRPVLVLPGFVGGDATTLPLRAFLRTIGHRPTGWGLGVNVGFADHIASGIDQLLQRLAHRHRSTVDIVGWSAGGMIGRLLAQHRRELVGQVISLGSPTRLRTGETNITALQDLAGRFFVPTPPKIDVDHVPVPSTTVWTAQDGVVPGRLCRQTPRPQVRGTHLGLGTNPSVLYLVADRLAQRPGDWRPFEPPKALRWWYPSIHQHDDRAGDELDEGEERHASADAG
jgi:pimeloyl-ACP methyl ester carboxylesterase